VGSTIKLIIKRIPLYLSLLYLAVIVAYFFSIFDVARIFEIDNFTRVCLVLIASFSSLVALSIIINRAV
jgi:hypothetical protein